MVSPAESVTIQVAEVSEGRSLLVGWGLAALAAGGILAAVAAMPSRRGRRGFRAAVAASAVLALDGTPGVQHGGAAPFFAAACTALFLLLFAPGMARWQASHRAAKQALSRRPAARRLRRTFSAVALLGLAGLTSSPGLRAQSDMPRTPWAADGSKPAESMVETWMIHDGRVSAEVALTVRGGKGDTFLLLRPPATLTEFKGDGLRVGKVERDGQTFYYVAAEREGTLTARARFAMPSRRGEAGCIAVATGPAATQRITLELDQGGWEFSSPMAVQTTRTAGLGENRSGRHPCPWRPGRRRSS